MSFSSFSKIEFYELRHFIFYVLNHGAGRCWGIILYYEEVHVCRTTFFIKNHNLIIDVVRIIKSLSVVWSISSRKLNFKCAKMTLTRILHLIDHSVLILYVIFIKSWAERKQTFCWSYEASFSISMMQKSSVVEEVCRWCVWNKKKRFIVSMKEYTCEASNEWEPKSALKLKDDGMLVQCRYIYKCIKKIGQIIAVWWSVDNCE